MGLSITDINEIILESKSGNQIKSQINDILKKLVENDCGLTFSENTIAPKLWEQSWLLNQNIDSGYSVGDAVWINTESVGDVVANNYSEISNYVMNNVYLNSEFSKINNTDQQQIINFFKKVVTGNASPYVSALYYLGDLTLPVQIRISTKNHNKSYPSDDKCWKDFYEDNSEEKNINLMYQCLGGLLSTMIQEHINEYHAEGVKQKTLQENYIINKPILDIDSIKVQNFYNHNYQYYPLEGFDYVVKYEYTDSAWYRLWKSGYLEQGGIAINDGQEIVDVYFLMEYNYPRGIDFYQTGYNSYNESQVSCGLQQSRRYCLCVTPMNITNPYQNEMVDIDGYRTYTNVDITKMSNSGFSFVNTDQSQESYVAFSFYVAGFKTVQNTNVVYQNKNTYFTVRFYDNHDETING